MDPTDRFSDRVALYVRYRPGYPEALLRTLVEQAGLGPGSVVADLGSGTGVSVAMLLRSGCEVYGVEPNCPMRRAAEEALGDNPLFHSVDGRAEATGLPDRSVDLVTAGQAFHWFGQEATRAEVARLLRPGGRVAVFWNARRTDSSPFLRAYEALLHRFGTDYAEVDHTRIDEAAMAPFFGGEFETTVFPNAQEVDFDGLRGRLLSSSYVPGPGQEGHEPMLKELRRIFDELQEGERVRFEYDTRLHLGRLG